MAELHSCSALVKSSSSSISYLEHMGSSLIEQSPTERSVVPISLSSKLVGLEGDRNSYQLERGGELPPGPNHLKRARWEELHLDAAFCRQSNGTGLSGQVSNVEGFSVSLPNYSSCTSLSAQVSNVEAYAVSLPNFSSCCNGNGHGHSSPPPMSVQCSPFVSQQVSSSGLPYLPIVNNHVLSRSAPPVMPYKQGGNIGSAECQTTEQHSIDNTDMNEVDGHDVNVTEVLAELERERRKNAELLDKLSSLEAQLEEREKAFAKAAEQVDSHSTIKKFKKVRKVEKVGDIEDADVQKVPNKVSQVKQENLHTGLEESIPQDTLVNWMSREEIQFPDYDKYKDGDSAMDEYGESDDSDDDDDFDEDDDHDEEDEEEDEDDDTHMRDNGRKQVTKQEEGEGGGTVFQGLDGASGVLDDRKSLNIKVGVKEDQNEVGILPVVSSHREDVNGDDKRVKKKNRKRRGGKKNKRYKVLYAKKCSGYDIGPLRGPSSVLSYKKAPKMAFCPKEVKRIMESGVLALKNAQSHTIRKIIVFASLGIRHGCEDMYELDFNYFSILRKGEPYVSPKDPGEHVVYEQPGVRRKIFYPNRQNPILCPIRIIEEEKAMRPSGPSCPSCLFLCIKYGGRTRNLPQNEYVRQRMGRNKLKSFGPLMCQMALLVHIRTGSFFFKALGITLLFMAGFPDDLVQKETKYRNLDLLQKYYRSDEDAEGEELFHPYPMFYAAQAMTNTTTLPGKGVSTGGKSSGKKQPPLLLSKPHIAQKALYLPPLSARSMSSAQFGPLGFSPVPIPSGVTHPHHPPPISSTSVAASASGTCNVSITTSRASHTGPFPLPPPYAIFPPYALQRPPSGFLPMPMWHNVNSYPPNIYPSSSYRYQSFTPSSQYGSHPSQPFYSQPFFPPFSSNMKDGMHKKDDELDVSDSDSESSSSETEEKSNKANISESKLV